MKDSLHSLAIVSNCTMDKLVPHLKNYFVEIINHGYDSFPFAMLEESSRLCETCLIYLSPLQIRDSFYQSKTKENFSEEYLKILGHTIETAQKKGTTFLITSIPTTLNNTFGNASSTTPQSLTYQLDKINQGIKRIVSKNDHCYLLDIEAIANRAGLDYFHSDKLWALGKLPCHPQFYPAIGKAIIQLASAIKGSVKKVLILDLDNTLWGGVIGDDGLSGISLGGSVEGEIFKSFQHYLKTLKDRGLLLVVCSKNDYKNAITPFREHPEMVLKEEDIALFVANWEEKSTNIKLISETLNLSTDTFIFIDDSPFERDEVRRALPEVFVPELSDDPSEFISIIDRSGALETVSFTDVDQSRTEQYQIESKRLEELSKSSNIEDYLRGLQMEGKTEYLNPANIERASQLIIRSNQFNLRTQRLTKDQISSGITLCFSLSDRFGDYGLISVVSCENRNDELYINELVMSCRVLKRGMESFIFNRIVQEAKKRGIKTIRAEYLPTQKNSLVKNLLSEFGFKNSGSSHFSYALSVSEYIVKKNYIKEVQP